MPDMNVASLTLPPSQSGMLIPDDVKRRILAAQLLQKQASDTTQPVYTTGLGMAKLAAGGLGGILEGWQDAQEKQDQAKSWENLANILSGKGPTPASAPAATQTSDTPTPPANVPVSSNDTNPVLSALTSNSASQSSDATPVERMAYASAAGETGVPSFANQGQIANDTGGSKSYGIFGLNTYAPNGNVADTSAGKFASNYGPQIGVTAQPGTPEFDAQWKSAAQNNPDALKAAQLDWYQKNIAGGVASKLADAGVPPAVASDPRVQTYFADRMVQQGAGSIDKHASRIAQALSASGGDPTAFLSSMSTLDRQSIPGDFRTYLSENPNNTPGLENRISKREQFALGQAPAMQAINNAMRPTQVASLNGAPTPDTMPTPGQAEVQGSQPQMAQASPAQAQAQASPAQMAQANPAQTAQTQMRLAQNIDPAAAMSVLRDPRVPPQMKQYLLQQINPSPNIMQMPDGTIVAVNPKTLQTTPVYKAQPKGTALKQDERLVDPTTGKELASSAQTAPIPLIQPQQRAMFGIQPDDKRPYQWDPKNGLKEVGGSLVTVDQRAPSAFETTYGEGMAKQALSTVDAGRSATNDLQRIKLMQGILQGIKTGKITPAGANMGAWLQSVGADPSMLGIDPSLPANAETFSAISNKMVLGQIGGQGGMPANNFSDADRKFLTSTLPSLANRPESNSVLLEAGARTAELSQQKANEWLDARSQGMSYEKFEQKWQHEMRDKNIFADLAASDGDKQALLANPGLKQAFDHRYGSGAADNVLSRAQLPSAAQLPPLGGAPAPQAQPQMPTPEAPRVRRYNPATGKIE